MPGIEHIRLDGVMMIVQPSLREDSLNGEEYRRLIEYQLDAGVTIVQSPQVDDLLTMSSAEFEAMLQVLVSTCKGRAYCVVTVSFEPWAERAVAHVRAAAEAGADVLKIQAPVHFGPDLKDEDFLAYFGSLAEASSLPILLYNNPRRCGFNISPALVRKIADKHPQVIGIQESVYPQALQVLDTSSGNLQVLCKYPYWVSGVAAGCRGVHASASYCPAQVVEVYRAAADGNFEQARDLSARYRPLFELHQIAPAPAVTKYCLGRMGFDMGESRSPQPAQVADDVRERVDRVMRNHGL